MVVPSVVEQFLTAMELVVIVTVVRGVELLTNCPYELNLDPVVRKLLSVAHAH